MVDNMQFKLQQLTALNNLVQNWSLESNQDSNAINELLLEFDMAVNLINDDANNTNDSDIADICMLFLNNLINFYESRITTKQIELICAWPFYLSEFITNYKDEETEQGLIEFLKDEDWPISYTPKDLDIQSDDLVFPEEEQQTPDNIVENNPALNEEQKEFLGLINAEIIDIQEQNTIRLTELKNSNEIIESKLNDEIDTQLDQLDRIASAAEMIGLQGLKKFCKQINVILNHIQKNDIQQFHSLIEDFLFWPEIIQAYLFAPDDSDYILAALDYLNLDCWPVQLSPVEQKNFEEAFHSSKVEVDNSHTPDRIHEAKLEDIDLNKPEDVPIELFDSLLQDLPEQTAEFSLAVQNLRSDDYLTQLEVSKRIAHTLKGAGNTVGIQGLANLTHHLEDILEALLKEHEKPTQALHNVIEDASDCLEEMSEHLHGMGNAPKDTMQVLQEVLNWANYIDKNGIPKENDSLNNNSQSSKNQTKADLNSEENTPIDSVVKPEENISEQSLRISTSLADDLLKQAGENIISNAQIQEYIMRSKYSAKQLRINNEKIKKLADQLEHLIEIRGFSSQFTSKNNLDTFDPLEMDQFNELNTYANLLIEAVADSNEIGMNIESSLLKLDDLSTNQKRILLENQETALHTRMVPVKSIIQRLRRSVKQANKLSDKAVKLSIVGEDILVDSDILNQLVDTLMHIIRNAVDHGIEASDFRAKLGKEEHGLIELQFQKKGKQILISCKDDGRGLDIDRIRSKAIDCGRLQEDAEFTKEDALELILQHGFSTKNDVSQLSGRGVGLDIVFSDIRNLKGSMSIDTDFGIGTNIELSVPITFNSTQALIVSCANNILAISNRGVEEILHPSAGGIIYGEDRPYFAYKQKRYPIFDLPQILFNHNNDKPSDLSQAILIIKDEFNKDHAILIDKILDSREIVVKPFSQYIPKMSGLLGSTIMGDGSVISVIDLLDIVNITDTSIPHKNITQQQESIETDNLHVLIVDDAISTRKSLSQFMNDLNYKVSTAKDGVEAIDIIQKMPPAIILTDLEMPRMNGLELTDHLRSNKATKDIPIIMITSRATDKHKKEALRIGVTEYMTKPYDEDILLNLINKMSMSI